MNLAFFLTFYNPDPLSKKENTEGYVNALNALQQASDNADFPEKPILQSMLGEIYMSFFLFEVSYFTKTHRFSSIRHTTSGFGRGRINTNSIGDKIRVKLTIKTLKPLEYVHLKDMRPATCEPVDVVSQREWQKLSYYKTTRDVSTNFFFDAIPMGEFTVEYNLTIQQRSDFASGVASLQCMYVPSVTAYTEGGV